MIRKWRKDRRVGYSFRAHFKRVLETKGFSHVALTLGATALIAGTAFANCRGSDITGPSSDPPRAAMDVSSTSTTSATSTTTSTTTSTSSTTETTKEGPFKLPFALLPPANPCRGDAIAWDHGSTVIQGTTQITLGSDGRYHAQFHFNAQGRGTSAARKYSGSQEYNSQTITVDPTSTNKFRYGWNVKIIAKGEDETLFPGDDFVMHVVATIGPPPTFIHELAEATAPPGECR